MRGLLILDFGDGGERGGGETHKKKHVSTFEALGQLGRTRTKLRGKARMEKLHLTHLQSLISMVRMESSKETTFTLESIMSPWHCGRRSG